MTRSRTTRLRIGGLTLPAAAIAALAGAATVFACTNVMGGLSITPTSGPAGTVVTTNASGLKPNATYALHFAKATNGNCMSFSGVITVARATANSTGAWSNIMATIPNKTTMGVHGFCGMELSPIKGNTGTTHDTFTVT